PEVRPPARRVGCGKTKVPPFPDQGYGFAGALFSWVAALLNTLPMLFRSTSRMAMRPTATRAMIRAYSTRPWPDSSLQKACHNDFIHPPWPAASFGDQGPPKRTGTLADGPPTGPPCAPAAEAALLLTSVVLRV